MIILALAIIIACAVAALATVAWLQTAGDAHKWIMRPDIRRPATYGNAPDSDPAI